MTANDQDCLQAGTTRESVVVHGLNRTQIVQYAGASGDFNPLHTDEVFATKVAGYPSVVAHGMLTMGLAGKALSEWFGVENLTSFGARFRNLVWPGDTLVTQVTVEKIAPGDQHEVVDVSLRTTNQRGELVLDGYASTKWYGDRADRTANLG